MQIARFVGSAFPAIKPKLTIRKKLKQDGFVPIRYDKFWDELAVAYIEQNYRPKWIRASARNTDHEIAYKLKKRSEEVMNEEYNKGNENFYIMASKWCTVPYTIGERAIKMGFNFLNMDEEDCPDDEIGTMRVMDYRPMSGEIDMTARLLDTGDIKKKIRIMKSIARDMVNRKNYEEKSELMGNTAIRWFTKQRP